MDAWYSTLALEVNTSYMLNVNFLGAIPPDDPHGLRMAEQWITPPRMRHDWKEDCRMLRRFFRAMPRNRKATYEELIRALNGSGLVRCKYGSF